MFTSHPSVSFEVDQGNGSRLQVTTVSTGSVMGWATGEWSCLVASSMSSFGQTTSYNQQGVADLRRGGVQ